METLPEGGIEDAEGDSRLDPARRTVDEDPYVRYTVKELIVKIDTKLDAYIKQQDDIRKTVDHMAPALVEVAGKVEALELAALKKAAVADWRHRWWVAAAGLSGLASIGAIVLAFVHH